MTKRELKHEMKNALRRAYGFAPSLNEITLLESAGDGQYILARIGKYEYSWDSHTMERREIVSNKILNISNN